MDWSRLFPTVDREYVGPKVPYYSLMLIALVSTARSLVHILAPDGGAGVIAGIDVSVQGGSNIIAIFGQWGTVQLILALFHWLAILRYRFLVPALLGVTVLEQLLRLGVGLLKPLQVSTAPPGAVGSQLLLPLAILAFLWSLRGNRR